ncbi:MAG: hypothetical protein WD070_05555 [Pirellulaceae bacterium]
MQNVFETIRLQGDDISFSPFETEEFEPTNAPVGSPEKLRVMAERVERGLPLWHPRDWPQGVQDDSLTLASQ